MASLIDNLGLSPKIAITGPDGKQLWIDPEASSDTPGFLSHFKATVQFGNVPADNPNITDSPAVFGGWEAINLLVAPGPLGLPLFAWIALGGYVLYRAPKMLSHPKPHSKRR